MLEIKASGELTDSQLRYAKEHHMTPDEFYGMILQHTIDEAEKFKTEQKAEVDDTIPPLSDNATLVIGHGTNWKEHLQQAKKFRGKKIVCDVCVKECIEAGLIPDYVSATELPTRHLDFARKLFNPMAGYGRIEFIVPSAIDPYILQYMNKISNGVTFFDVDGMHGNPNVGLYAILAAHRLLKSDQIFLIGMEHTGTQYCGAMFEAWVRDFWQCVRHMKPRTIINCSEGGRLYDGNRLVLGSSLNLFT